MKQGVYLKLLDREVKVILSIEIDSRGETGLFLETGDQCVYLLPPKVEVIQDICMCLPWRVIKVYL